MSGLSSRSLMYVAYRDKPLAGVCPLGESNSYVRWNENEKEDVLLYVVMKLYYALENLPGKGIYIVSSKEGFVLSCPQKEATGAAPVDTCVG